MTAQDSPGEETGNLREKDTPQMPYSHHRGKQSYWHDERKRLPSS